MQTLDDFVQVGSGASLHYQAAGDPSRGIPLLLLRPLGGNVDSWGAFREYLTAEFFVLSFDYRGSGHSSPAPLWFTTRQMARDAASLLATLDVPRVHVFGESLGGMVATWLAVQSPHRVEKLVLGSTSSRGLFLTRRGLGRKMELARCMLGPRGQAEVCLAREVLSASFRRSTAAQGIESAVRDGSSSRWELLKLMLAVATHDARRQLPRIGKATLVLAGALDAIVSPSVQAQVASRIPNARFEIIEEAGHAITVEQPQATASRVGAFLAE